MRVGPKNLPSRSHKLPEDEEIDLRNAFGRFARAACRSRGSTVAKKYQIEGAGRWFYCSCRGDNERYPPVLVPRGEDHIVRASRGGWKTHDERCDFFREPHEQRMLVRTYHCPEEASLNLIQNHREDQTFPRTSGGTSYLRKRPALATLLARLMTAAGLQCRSYKEDPCKRSEQFRNIRDASADLQLAPGISLADWLITYDKNLNALVHSIGKQRPETFGGKRPHGILITLARTCDSGQITTIFDTTIPVRGAITIFGERNGADREAAEALAARSPYLVICLIAAATAGDTPEVLKAYAHPCLSEDDLMMVDSDRERVTFTQLQSVQTWLHTKKNRDVAIEKPLFDIGPEVAEDEDPREPCVPDFIVKIEPERPDGDGNQIIVETMGFDTDDYRTRKARMHPLMSQALSDAEVIEHDFYRPKDKTQYERDTAFWRRVRWALTGPE